MKVRIDQARDHGAAGKLDHLGAVADVAGNRRLIAYREESSVLDGDGLGDMPLPVNRDHLAAAQHEISRLGEPGAAGNEAEQICGCELHSQTMAHRGPLKRSSHYFK